MKAPMALLAIVRTDANIRTNALYSPDLRTLKKGIKKAQKFRHGRAEDDWDVLRKEHLSALIALDQHPALQVLELVDGMNFEEAVSEVFAQEAKDLLPLDLKDHQVVSDLVECDACWRMTPISEDIDAFGINVGEGICIACGTKRTYEDTVLDYISWKFGDPS